jgi:hypothetical protein
MGAKPSITSPKNIKHSDSLRELEIRIKTMEAIEAEAKAEEAIANTQEAIAKAEASVKVAKASVKVAKENTKVAKVKTGLVYLFVAIPPFLACDYFFRGTRQGRKLLVKCFLFSTRFKISFSNWSPTRLISHPSRENVVRKSILQVVENQYF